MNEKFFSFERSFDIPSSLFLELETIHFCEKKENTFLHIRGPLGTLRFSLTQLDPFGFCCIEMNLKSNPQTIRLLSFDSSKKAYSFFKTLCTLLESSMVGVTRGFVTHLDLVGIGYRGHLELQNHKELGKNQQILDLKVGQSHSMKIAIPFDVYIFLPRPTSICLYGIEKQKVTQLASFIRSLKLPEPYKGKGIRYSSEQIRIKQGKKK